MNKKILVADDEESIRWVLGKCLEKAGYRVEYAVNGSEALEKSTTENFSLTILDITMPELSGLEVLHEIRLRGMDLPILIITAQNTVKNAIDAMKKGAYDYIAKPFDLDEVRLTVERAIEGHENAKKLNSLKATLHEVNEKQHGIVGKSSSMLKIYKTIGRIADKDLTVLIQGESGTGKELIVRAIHINSPRKEVTLVSVNVNALPKGLLESELFGYEKGAFTGATIRKQGRFEEASGGTLHLDEIGEMPLDLQTKLLRVLEEKKFYRLGSEKPDDIDVRVIASTNKKLEDEVEAGNFRQDLYYRLNAITIEVPPLRERKEDISLLLEYFLEKYSIELGIGEKTITDEAKGIMLDYSWPGNVRELENTIKRILVLSSDMNITSDILIDAAPYLKGLEKQDPFSDLFTSRLKKLINDNKENAYGGVYDLVIRKVEKPLIEEILKISKGNKKKAAEILGINRNTLSKKIEEYGINFKHILQ
ncbi:sigma-54 dependent transcriptional regulator [Desulfobacterota bacterium AH_259_B03_O07]|nr:sigma-54 dependent transcriptional regulator [Desulfobacterota bacterium AH_259_B03_O07]